MSAPPLKKTVSNCINKMRFADEFAARAHAMRVLTGHRSRANLWVYRCPECNGWHLTKRDRGTRQLVTADSTYTESAA